MKNITIWGYTYRFEIWESHHNKKPTLTIYSTYKKNKEKRVQWYYYQDMEALETSKEKFIKTRKDNFKRNEDYKAERKIKDVSEKARLREIYKVWDLFSYSWGYDQTNVEYFQITEKKWAKVYIKRIWGKTTSIDSWASQHSSPCRDAFLDWYHTEDNGWKVIWRYWISMAFWTLNLTNEQAEHFSSSRA